MSMVGPPKAGSGRHARRSFQAHGSHPGGEGGVAAGRHCSQAREPVQSRRAYGRSRCRSQAGPDGRWRSSRREKGAMAVRRKESVEGNEGLTALLVRAASILGVEVMPLLATHPAVTLNNEAAGSTSGSPSSEDPDIRGPRFGWPELQVSLMQLGIHLAESLPITRRPPGWRSQRSVNCTSTSTAKPGTPLSDMDQCSQRHQEERRRMEGIGWWIPGRMVLSLEVAR